MPQSAGGGESMLSVVYLDFRSDDDLEAVAQWEVCRHPALRKLLGGTLALLGTDAACIRHIADEMMASFSTAVRVCG